MVGASFLGLFLRLEIGIAKAEHITNSLFTTGSVGAVLATLLYHCLTFLSLVLPDSRRLAGRLRLNWLFILAATSYLLNCPIKCKRYFVPWQALDLISKDGYKVLVFVPVNKAL